MVQKIQKRKFVRKKKTELKSQLLVKKRLLEKAKKFPLLNLLQKISVNRRRIIVSFVGLFLLFGIVFFFLTKDLPNPASLQTNNFPLTTRIYDRTGKILYRIFTDKNRTLVKLSDLPTHVKWATIAMEDKDFYKHRGLSVRGIGRAVYKLATRGQVQGGSTITQQLVKTAFLTPERTPQRKIKELYLALRTEGLYSKDQILEQYLNQVPYGGTAWGIQAAAETYFGKDAKDLTLAEATLLAGLPQAPSRYSPFNNPNLAKERQILVLNRMVEENYIKKEEAEIAKNEELKFAAIKNNIKAPHFVMHVREILSQKYGEKLVDQGGLQVYTSLDLDIQEDAESGVKENVDKLKNLRVSNGAALVTKPPTGEILAMVGSKDFFDQAIDGNVNVTVAQRQPGSSIKPINYATGLAKGLITPATIIVDLPVQFSDGATRPYRPVNYDGRFHGPVSARLALGSSYNIPAVKVLAKVGVRNMINTAKEMGITTFEDESRYGLSLTLGGGEVKMTDMAVSFGVFANQGKRVDLQPILKVQDSQGKVLEEFKPPEGKEVIAKEVAFLISHILGDNEARSAAFGPSSFLNIGGQFVSVKTGTTDDKRDNWTIGYTSSFLVAAWVGNNDNTPMHPTLASGITGAAPIWNAIMKEVLKGRVPEYPKQPEGIVAVEICKQTGGLATEACDKKTEYFIKGTEPKEVIFNKNKVWVDIKTGKVVPPNTPESEEKEVPVVVDLLDPNQSYCVGCPFTLENKDQQTSDQNVYQQVSTSKQSQGP